MVCLSHFAAHNEDGTKVENPKFPFEVWYEPTDEVETLFSAEQPKPFDELKFLKDLTKLKAGTVVWNVYAFDSPSEKGAKKV